MAQRRQFRTIKMAVIAASALLAACDSPSSQPAASRSRGSATPTSTPRFVTPNMVQAAALQVALLSGRTSAPACPLGDPTRLAGSAGILDRIQAATDHHAILGMGSGVIVCRFYSTADDRNGATFIAGPSKQAIDAYFGDHGKPDFGAATPMLRGSVQLAASAYLTKDGPGPGCDAMWTSTEVKLVIAIEDTWPGADCAAEMTGVWTDILYTLSGAG